MSLRENKISVISSVWTGLVGTTTTTTTCRSIAHRASESEMLLAHKESLLVPDKLMALFSSLAVLYLTENTVNSLRSDNPWCKTKWPLTGDGRLQEKPTKKPNVGLTDQLHKDITLSAKIRQIEISCLLCFFTCNNFWEKYNRVYLSMCHF